MPVGAKHSCELPFGFIWTPMAVGSDATLIPMTDAMPPVLCLTCLAYLNPYASFDSESGEWQCPLCGETNVAPKEIFTDSSSALAPIMVSPIVEYRQHVVAAGGTEASTPTVNNSSCYILVLDGNLARDEAHAVATSMQSFFRKANGTGKKVSLGLIVFSNAVSMYQLGLLGMCAADVYTLYQADFEKEDEEHTKRRTRMAGQSYLIDINSEADLNPLWQCLSAVYGLPLNPQVVNPSDLSLQTKAPLSRKEQLRLRKEARLRKQSRERNGCTPEVTPALKESPWVKKRNEYRSVRCTGEAIQCAIDMAECGSSVTPRTCRILLFTNGCPSIGRASVVKPPRDLSLDDDSTNAVGVHASFRMTQPHVVDPYYVSKATRYFGNLAKDACEYGIGIDVFCTGAESLGMPTYQALVEPSGGYALPHESFKTPHLAKNLEHSLSRTHISRTEALDMESQPATIMNQMNGCIVDFRMSSFVSPTHVVGNAQVLYGEHGLLANERSSFSLGACLAANRGFRTNNLPSLDMLAASLTRLSMGRYDPLSTLSTMLRVNDSFHPSEKHAFFQCIVRYVEPDGKTIVNKGVYK